MQQFPPYFTGYENHSTQQQGQSAQPNQSQDASQQQPLLSGSNLAIYSPAGLQPLSVLAAAQRKEDPNQMTNAASSMVGVPVELGAHGKPKRKQVKNACINCQKACKKCDIGRPCQRCIKYGITDTCINSVRKERKKGIKRGPYKKRNGESGPSSGASTPNVASPMAAASMYNGVRPAGIPIHYQHFPPGHYDPYAVYTSNGQIMPQAYMVPATMQQMYPNHPAMSYQTAMNIISPQQQQQQQQQQQPQEQQIQEQQQLQEQQQEQQQYQQKFKEYDEKIQTQMCQVQSQQSSPQQQFQQPQPNVEQALPASEEIKTEPVEDEDDEGSKLTILSRLCSAVLDRNDSPKEEIKNEENQENTPPASRPHFTA